MPMLIRLVDYCRRHAAATVAVCLALAVVAGWYTAEHASVDSDTSKLVDPNLPWQRASDDLDRQFPQNNNLLLVVVDGQTPEQASDAAADLAHALAQQKSLFRYVRQPEANPYFRRYGLLFLSETEVQDFCDHLVAAQPFLGTIAADPSLRGVLDSVDLLAQGALHGEVDAKQIDPPLTVLAGAAEAAAAGRHEPISWQEFLTGRKPDKGDRRHFVLASANQDYSQIQAGTNAIEAVRKTAHDLGLDPASGVTVRITGQVALDNDQLAALSRGAVTSTLLCFGLLCFWLVVGLRSFRTMLAVVITLVVGLILCATFAVCAIGPFNPVSMAFAPLFIGIAVDFGIQFSVRYAAERLTVEPVDAFKRTAAGIGAPLTVAAVATAAGFLSFAPTAYLGVRDLGVIAGGGMIVALLLNLTLLPALLVLLRTGAAKESAGHALGAVADRFLLRRRGWVGAALFILAVGLAAALPRLRFDFNPVDLENRHAESVATLFDLMADPETSPYTIDFLASPAEAQTAVARLQKLPEIGRVLDPQILIPEDQGPKLAVLQDAAMLLEPTLVAPTPKPPPSPAEAQTAIRRCADDMSELGRKGDQPAARLAAALTKILDGGPAAVAALTTNFSEGIERRLDDLREVFKAAPVSVATLPPEFRRDWVAPDGRWRVQVFPSGDVRDNRKLRQFARAVQSVVPQAVGPAVTVDEWTKLAPRTFATAGLLALVAMALLLWAVLRRPRDVALVLVPLLVAGLCTLGAAALLGFSINFANIITLPMMLGIGVAFNIYFVMRWRAGEPGLLGSPTARAVLYSALTTGTAFGSLALAPSPGMAEMGKFLGLALFFVLGSTLFVLPVLLGGDPVARNRKQ